MDQLSGLNQLPPLNSADIGSQVIVTTLKNISSHSTAKIFDIKLNYFLQELRVNKLLQGESSGRSTPSSDSAPGKLFVGGLSWQTNQDRLREYFGQFGTVTDVLVMKDPITQVSILEQERTSYVLRVTIIDARLR